MKFKKENDLELFSIAGGDYYFDLDELSEFVRVDKPGSVEALLGSTKEEEEENPEEIYSQVIDLTKWETTKVMIESVLTESEPVDEAMGLSRLSSQLSIPFKLSFNTLLKYKMIALHYRRKYAFSSRKADERVWDEEDGHHCKRGHLLIAEP